MNAAALLACEPVPFVAAMFAGPGPTEAYILGTGGVLAVVVAIKCAIFGWYLRDVFGSAIFAMLVANVASTVVGTFLGAMLATPPVAWISAILTGVVIFLAARKFDSEVTEGRPFLRHPGRLGFYGAIVAFLAMAVGGGAIFGADRDSDSVPWVYFALKFLSLLLALLPSLLLTILLEFRIASSMLSESGRARVFRAAAGATLWTFFGIFFIGAALALPKRLRHARFLLPPR